MKRVLLALVLAMPAAAQAKGPLAAELCGPDACRAVADVPWHVAESAPPPAAAPYFELRSEGRVFAYYEPRSGLVARAEDYGAVSWTPAAFRVTGLRPFPPPRVTDAWVGDRRVTGDASGYLKLVTLEGPWATPERLTEFSWIRLEAARPDPWTSQALVYYPRDRVLLTRGSVYVRVPDRIAAALEAATPMPERTTIPWIAIGAALAGSAALVALRTLGSWSGSSRPSSSSTSSGRPRWRPGRTRRSSAAA